jgi:hypothetical protein
MHLLMTPECRLLVDLSAVQIAVRGDVRPVRTCRFQGDDVKRPSAQAGIDKQRSSWCHINPENKT